MCECDGILFISCSKRRSLASKSKKTHIAFELLLDRRQHTGRVRCCLVGPRASRVVLDEISLSRAGGVAATEHTTMAGDRMFNDDFGFVLVIALVDAFPRPIGHLVEPGAVVVCEAGESFAGNVELRVSMRTTAENIVGSKRVVAYSISSSCLT